MKLFQWKREFHVLTPKNSHFSRDFRMFFKEKTRISAVQWNSFKFHPARSCLFKCFNLMHCKNQSSREKSEKFFFFFIFLHFSSFFFIFLHFSSFFFIFLRFSSFFFVFLRFSSLFFTFLHFSSLFFTFLHFSLFFRESAGRFF